jgi:transcriptional regulator with XRE-family HTH domain
MKAKEREEARRLRREAGMSMKAIARELEVSVSSVSLWTRDIELTADQTAFLAAANARLGSQRIGHEARSRNARAERLKAQTDGRRLARNGDPLHQAGCMLYWAEGSKSGNSAALSNSDPNMLCFFKRFLEECYTVATERFCFNVNCYTNNGLSVQAIEAHWLGLLQLPQSCARKAIVNNPSRASKVQKRNLPYGTARLMVHSTAILQSIFGAIQEYAGFDEPTWLG